MDFFTHLQFNNIHWYHSFRPLNESERDTLAVKFNLLKHHVNSTEKGKTPRPKISVNRKYVHFVLHIPYRSQNSKRITICDFNIFVLNNTLITIESQGNVPSIKTYFEKTRSNSRSTERRLKHGSANLLLNLLNFVVNDIEFLIDKQGEQVDNLDNIIFQPHRTRQTIEIISTLRYNQIAAFNALERQARLFEPHLNTNPLSKFDPNTEHKWTSFVEQIQTLAYELSSDVEHLEGLVKTFETLVTHQTNETIKILTIFSVLLLPLTLISGVYGMNFVHIPLSQHPSGFFQVLLTMFTLGCIMLIFFKYKKWI